MKVTFTITWDRKVLYFTVPGVQSTLIVAIFTVLLIRSLDLKEVFEFLFHNQLELPTLFYVVVLLALITQTLDVVLLVLSWMFVLARLVHAYIHVTSNRLDRRTGIFAVGVAALFLMWVIVVARFLLQAAS